MRIVALAMIWLVGLGGVAHADSAEVDALFAAARAELERDPAAACAKFEKAQALQPDSVAIVLNLGLCNERLGKLGSAFRWYTKTISVAIGSKDPNAKDYVSVALDATAKLTDQVARVTITLSPGVAHPSLGLYLNGSRVPVNTALELDAGENTIEARQEGKVSFVQSFVVKNGERVQQSIGPLRDLPRPPSRTPRRLAGVGIAVGSIVAASVGTGLWARSIQRDVNDGTITEEDGRDQIFRPTVAWFAISLAGSAVGAYFFFTKPKWNVEAATNTGVTNILPTVTPELAGLAVSGRF